MFETYILLGKWTERELDRILNDSALIHDIAERTDFLSRHFLDLAYVESTLIGDLNTPEVFVINLEGVDCLTFLEYVEAMRLSSSFQDFKRHLIKIRYKSGDVSFINRNHFFTDWVEFNAKFIEDITEKISSEKTSKVQKFLNEKEDKTFFVQGINPVMREIRYISSEDIDEMVLNRLRTGDYIGIYSHLEGLDVSHVGIFIRESKKVFLRHASSALKNRKVIDEDFMEYITEKPGIIVLRPKTYTS